MRWTWLPLVLAVVGLHQPAFAQDATAMDTSSETADEPVAPTPAETADETVAPTPAETAAQAPLAEEPATPATPAMTSAGDDDSDSMAGWAVIGIGGSMAAANIALGASLLAQGQTNAELRLGSATLTAGITGFATSLLVGLLIL